MIIGWGAHAPSRASLGTLGQRVGGETRGQEEVFGEAAKTAPGARALPITSGLGCFLAILRRHTSIFDSISIEIVRTPGQWR
jgi:hypothetical protein